jgi:hypothetical protein
VNNKQPYRILVLAGALALFLTARAHAQQVPPFFGGPVSGYDVEIGIIDAGAILIALQTFPVLAAVAGSGYVGGVDPSGALTPAAPRTSPSDIDRAARDAASVLNHRGVYLLAALK